MGMKRKRQLSSVIFHAGACILGFFMIYPLLWLLASSFKSNETMFTNTYSLLPEVWDAAKNYASGFAGIGGVAFSTFFMNSMVVTVVGTVTCVLSSLLAAYTFSRLKFLVWLCDDDDDDSGTGYGGSAVYYFEENPFNRYTCGTCAAVVFRRCVFYLSDGSVFSGDSERTG